MKNILATIMIVATAFFASSSYAQLAQSRPVKTLQ